MKKKNVFNINCLLGSIASMTILPIAIVGCSKTNNNNQELPTNLNEEVARINNLNLSLKNDFLTEEQINGFISGPLTFLSQQVNNWSVNKEFLYNPKLTNDQSKKQLKLIIEIVDKSNSENKVNSKEFIFTYRVAQNLDKEVQRINDSQIRLVKEKFTQNEVNQIDASKIKEYLTNVEFKNDIFNYEVINFLNKNSEFQFKFKISDLQNKNDFRESKEFKLAYQIEMGQTSPSTTIKEEVERINSQFNPELLKKSITYQELLDINKKNLLDKISNTRILDRNKFVYIIYVMTKVDKSETKHIEFNFVINFNDQSEPNYNNFTKTFHLNYNLLPTQKPEYNIETDYLKNNVVDPITNGSYSFSTPGSGTGKNSIIPTNGPSKTAPSSGIPENGKSAKGFVYSEAEVKQLKNTFSLSFVDYSGGVALGTGWILDYKLTEDGSYPTTWYIATNAHVIKNLKVPNDVISPERFEISDDPREFYNTYYVKMRTARNPQIGKEIPRLEFYENEHFISADIFPNNLKTIYIGTDFLYTSPGDFSTDGRWVDNEEYADFAVMEVKFKDADEAKKMTHDYVNDSSRHFKYKKESLLKGDAKQNSYSAIGFPDAGRTSSFDMSVDLITTREGDEKNKPINKDPNKWTSLADSPYYNTFNGKIGVFDAAIGFSFFGMPYTQAFQLMLQYNSWGLVYPVNYSNLGAGSSGSMLMDKDGYTVGIHFAGDPSATMGFSQALYCEGFNYQGKFGSYNLEGYDLIEGGFPNQRTSYKENLIRLYGKNFKTNLFKNGL